MKKQEIEREFDKIHRFNIEDKYDKLISEAVKKVWVEGAIWMQDVMNKSIIEKHYINDIISVEK